MTWRYALSSIAGTSHIAAEKPCDDACRCELVEIANGEQALIAVVSDGAGSAELSRFGSALVVETLVERAGAWLREGGEVRALTRDILLDWLDDVRDRISAQSKEDYSHPKDYAATLVLAVLGQSAGAFAQLGDGAVVVSPSGGEWKAVFWPQHGDYANQTYFVTDDAAHENIAFEIMETPIEDVVLFTDGLERVLLDFSKQKAHPPVFARMVGPLRRSAVGGEVTALSQQLAEYLRSPGITERADDDLTLVVSTCRPAETAG